jgi:hypothetical protein
MPLIESIAGSPLALWENFYVIVGSSAAALTGLMFVVIALVADRQTNSSGSTVDAFGTPTVNHFCAALLTSAIISAPWRSLDKAGIALTLVGAAGTIYTAVVFQRARKQSGYKPVLEDWLFHVLFPFCSYLALVPAAFLLSRHSEPMLFTIGGAVLFLVFIGIHNAWDTVTFIALNFPPKESDSSPPK